MPPVSSPTTACGAVTTAERVERLNALEISEAAAILATLPQQKAVRILDRPELHNAAAILAEMPVEHAARLLNATANDRVADIFLELDDDARAALFARLDAPDCARRSST